MLRNYVVVALRNLLRHKAYSAINIAGLSIGLAFSVIAVLSVRKEWGYDSFHEKSDQIHRVIRQTRSTDGSETFRAGTSGLLSESLKRDLPEVLQSTRLHQHDRGRMIYGETKIDGDKMLIGDLNLFSVFDFPFARGDTSDLIQPYTIALTESAATRYFGDEDPIGKVITRDARYYAGDYKVTAVLKDPPEKSSIHFDFFSGTKHLGSVWTPWPIWQPHGSYRLIQTFVVLPEAYETGLLEAKLPSLMIDYLGTEVEAFNSYHLQPLTRIHMYSNTDYGMGTDGDITTLYMTSVLALFILVIASINYMNLATARSAGRGREVGLRKVMGAQRAQLARQFLVESVMVALLALVLAIWFLEVVAPVLLEFEFSELDPYSGLGIPAMAAVSALVGLMAGSYPAFFLTAFQPSEVLKGGAKGLRKPWVRRGLVVFQFGLSIGLVIVTLVILEQHEFMGSRDEGFDKEGILTVPLFSIDSPSYDAHYRTVKAEFLEHPNITKVSVHQHYMFSIPFDTVQPEGYEGNEWQMRRMNIDETFFDLHDLQIARGRGFSEEIASDSTQAYILNEAAVEALGWDEPLGKSFGIKGYPRGPGRVVGVVENFHARPVREPLGPVLFYQSRNYTAISMKISPENVDETLAFIREMWYKYIPDHEFEYVFLKDHLLEYYDEERNLAFSFSQYAGLAIAIGCMGLLGLAAYMSEQRTREIGIRRVLGATVAGIVSLLSSEFVKLVLVAVALVSPVVFLSMRDWLNEFAYRIELGPGPFIAGGAGVLFVAMLVVGAQALRAALSKPVDALRHE